MARRRNLPHLSDVSSCTGFTAYTWGTLSQTRRAVDAPSTTPYVHRRLIVQKRNLPGDPETKYERGRVAPT